MVDRISNPKQKYSTDGDRLRLIAEAVQDYDGLTDGACRDVIRSILFPSRVDDKTYEWGQQEVKRLIDAGLLDGRPE